MRTGKNVVYHNIGLHNNIILSKRAACKIHWHNRRPLTSDSIIQFSPNTFSPSRRGAEWIADCSLKPFTFVRGPWTARKYRIRSICCLQNSLNGHSENALRPARTQWHTLLVNRNDDELRDSKTLDEYLCSIIDDRGNKISLDNRRVYDEVVNEGKFYSLIKQHRAFTDSEIIRFMRKLSYLKRRHYSRFS